jgi:hypothetical protein
VADNKQSFLWAIKQQESGGNYNSVNSSSGALGAYQVMPANVASWTQQALGYSLSPQQYLSNPGAQDAVANTILGGYYDKYGAGGAAAMWYSGQPDPNKTYGDPPVYDYVKEVLGRMGSSPPASGSTNIDTGSSAGIDVPIPGLGTIPVPTTGDLGSGIEKGLVNAFKDVVGPALSWGLWVLECAAGLVFLAMGAYLSIRQTPIVKNAESTVKNTASAEFPALGAVRSGKSLSAPKRSAPRTASKKAAAPRSAAPRSAPVSTTKTSPAPAAKKTPAKKTATKKAVPKKNP